MQMSPRVSSLFAQNWLEHEESIVFIAKPGEGNMNCVLVVKQQTLFYCC
jgi:hypothetical protein